MADDWQPGDLALCIDDNQGEITKDGDPVKLLRRGKTYVVEALDIDPAFAEVGLHLEGVPRPYSALWRMNIGWSERRFRKITPPEADEFDREVIELMKGKPAKVEP